MADAMEVWSDKEQKLTIKKKCLSSARDGTDAVINVGSSTNQELQEYYKHLVREIPTKEKQQRSVQTNLEFLQTWIITLKNKYIFQVFYRQINECNVPLFNF